MSPESDRFEWLLGAFYTDEDSASDPQTYTLVEPGTETPAAGCRPAGGRALPISTYKELALFANATWHVTDRFDFSFGGRWSDNDQEATQRLTIGLPPVLGGGTAVFSGMKSSESPFTWSVSPRYRVHGHDLDVCARRDRLPPGGPNVLPPDARAGSPRTIRTS